VLKKIINMKKNVSAISMFTAILVCIISCTPYPQKPGGNTGVPRTAGAGSGGRAGQGGAQGGAGQVPRTGGVGDLRGGDIGNFKGVSLKDIRYGGNTPLGARSDSVQDLKLDIYFPDVNYSGKKYPLILWIHGGGFLVGDKSTSWKICSRAAGYGFVTVSMNYRLGWSRAGKAQGVCSGDSTSQKAAIYLATQDAKAALRFLVANAATYSIDTNWIFMAGPSAGGATPLFTKYVTQEDANRFLPGASTKYGLLDRADNNLTNTYTIKGICAMWGALNEPALITQQNAVPTLFIHGMKDPVAPYDRAPSFHCKNFSVINGSSILYNRMTNVLKIPAVLITDPNGGHGVYDNNSNCDNMCIFFKSIINKKPLSGSYMYNVKLQLE
jgi:pimeloyl-ACP methyl ester carboxylesterase